MSSTPLTELTDQECEKGQLAIRPPISYVPPTDLHNSMESETIKVKTVPMNVSFAEADLASHVLRMCPYTWQDQSNLHKKGGTHVDMRLLLLSLEATESVCSQERSNESVASRDEKPSHSDKKGIFCGSAGY